ncbi:hypothetical protein [Aquimarina sp. AU474]|uniref:hypothetical protein n=1 Tax=Aquimarina sp. AU474 TaxID=2108529 RepID=UPI000D6975B4|nr:hypothetical protein [Aquimarina sp. AU474]
MKNLEVNKMESINGGGCIGMIGSFIGMVASTFITPIGLGIATGLAAGLSFVDNAMECAEG